MSKLDDIFKGKISFEDDGDKIEAVFDAPLAKQEVKQLFLDLVGEDEPDTRKDSYSVTAIYKDYRNDLRAELRKKIELL